MTALDALRERWDKPMSRPCAGCTACCDHFEIEEISKASKQLCPMKVAGGCGVHASPQMPKACSRYACAWAMGYGKPSDRPDRSGAIVDFRDGLAGPGLYGHLTCLPTQRTLRAMERISADAGLDVHLEKKAEG